MVFDVQGRICAVSNDHPAQPLLGQTLRAAWLPVTLALPDSQRYAASAFEASSASAGLPTYV